MFYHTDIPNRKRTCQALKSSRQRGLTKTHLHILRTLLVLWKRKEPGDLPSCAGVSARAPSPQNSKHNGACERERQAEPEPGRMAPRIQGHPEPSKIPLQPPKTHISFQGGWQLLSSRHLNGVKKRGATTQLPTATNKAEDTPVLWLTRFAFCLGANW